jgi:hypothetical protein
MPWVEFEPTISVFERPKTVHALDRAATVIFVLNLLQFKKVKRWGGVVKYVVSKTMTTSGICLIHFFSRAGLR